MSSSTLSFEGRLTSPSAPSWPRQSVSLWTNRSCWTWCDGGSARVQQATVRAPLTQERVPDSYLHVSPPLVVRTAWSEQLQRWVWMEYLDELAGGHRYAAGAICRVAWKGQAAIRLFKPEPNPVPSYSCLKGGAQRFENEVHGQNIEVNAWTPPLAGLTTSLGHLSHHRLPRCKVNPRCNPLRCPKLAPCCQHLLHPRCLSACIPILI